MLHRPDAGVTVQLGDGGLLARETGIAVVYDMRANDMAHGGQGAPLIPAYHAALAAGLSGATGRAVVFVNIGGISNITFIGSRRGDIVAFDSGPGNTLIDQWVEAHAGIPYDQGGMIASEGQRRSRRSRSATSAMPSSPPRCAARSTATISARRRAPDASLEDGARTLAHVTAAAILRSARHLPERPKLYVVCGGGRLNRVIMGDLAALAEVGGRRRWWSAEAVDLDGDSMEAEAWAYLAVRSLRGLPLTFPGTTGVKARLFQRRRTPETRQP
jgi:anhydro-N-acetylmuramic acid kinase